MRRSPIRAIWLELLLAATACASSEAPTSQTTVTAASVPAGQNATPPREKLDAAASPLVPPGAQLISTMSLAEIHAFPEEMVTTQGMEPTRVAVRARATDRLYRTDLPFENAVGFVEGVLTRDRFTVARRVTNGGATFWSVVLPDGKPARIAVRRTSPTTVEIIAAGRAGSSEQSGSPQLPK